MEIRTIIVDDERLAVAGLAKLIEKNCPELTVVATCTTFKEALKAINSKKPDLVFLDIEMPHANGFELLDALSYKDFKLIFTTAYANYAIQAIKIRATDYLLKPIDPEELIQTVKSICVDFDAKISSDGSRLIINTQDSVFYVNQEEIVFLKSDGNYTLIQLKNGKIITVSQTIKRLEEKLDVNRFIRVHHSYIVNQEEIFEFNKTNLKLTLNDGTVIPVSTRKKKLIIK